MSSFNHHHDDSQRISKPPDVDGDSNRGHPPEESPSSYEGVTSSTVEDLVMYELIHENSQHLTAPGHTHILTEEAGNLDVLNHEFEGFAGPQPPADPATGGRRPPPRPAPAYSYPNAVHGARETSRGHRTGTMSAPAAAGSHAGHNPPEFGAPSTRSPTVSTEPSQPYFYHADIDWFLSPGRAYLYDSAAASVPPTGSHLDALRYQQTGSAMNFSSATYYPGFGTPSTLHPEAGIISPSFPLGYSGHNVGAKLDVDMSKGNFGYEGALPASTGPPGAQLEMLEPVAPVAEQSQSASPNPDAPAAHPHRPSRLRSGSRARRNGPARPSPTAEERKSRSSHNLVEKQYRNRLNAQFDSLLDVLPDAMRSAAVPGPGPGAEESEGVFRADLSTAESCERRVSKGEVLELARRRIQMLERERDDIAYERDRLLVTVDRLRGMLGDDAEDEVDEEEDGIDGDDDHGGDSGEG